MSHQFFGQVFVNTWNVLNHLFGSCDQVSNFRRKLIASYNNSASDIYEQSMATKPDHVVIFNLRELNFHLTKCKIPISNKVRSSKLKNNERENDKKQQFENSKAILVIIY